jgi:hypothetical protein
VLERASEIASACIAPGQSAIKGSMAPLPLNDDKTAARRENLFKVQTTRSKMIEATKSITDTQHGLAQALITTISKDFDDQHSAEREDLVAELSQLDEVKTSAREVLEASSLNKTGIEVLDGLLKLVVADTTLGILHQLSNDDQFPIFAASEEPLADSEARFPEDQDEEVDFEVVAAEIQKVYGIPIDYLADKKLNDSKPRDFCQIRASGKRFQAVQVTKPLEGNSIVGKAELKHLDTTSATWLKEMATEFDEKRFILNFRDFEALVTRPEDCANAKPKANYWIRKHNHLDIARDNIAHVRRLLCHMRENGMISDLDNVQLTMRRMYAFLALMYGCVAEGAILLTVMDQLLENLAKSVIGNVNPKLESEKMQSAIRAMHQQPSMRKRALAINDLKRLEREHKAREVFAEVVRFYHGAAILLFSAASGGKSEEVESQTIMWWEGIINLSSKCGHSKCVDQLEIKKSKKVTGEGDRWALSIAVKDSRIGFPEERLAKHHLPYWTSLRVTNMVITGLWYPPTALLLILASTTSYLAGGSMLRTPHSSTTSPICGTPLVVRTVASPAWWMTWWRSKLTRPLLRKWRRKRTPMRRCCSLGRASDSSRTQRVCNNRRRLRRRAH